MAVRLYANEDDLIALSPASGDHDTYAARIRAVTVPYVFIGVNTHAEWVTYWSSLTADQKVSAQFGIEYPWNEIINAPQGSTPDPTWIDGTTYPQVQTEFTRQLLGTVTGATTTNQLKTAAVGLWTKVSTDAAADGNTNRINYGGPWSFNNTTGGIPRSGLKASSTVGYWLSSGPNPTFTSVVNTQSGPTGGLETMMLANAGATADGISNYSFIPNGTDWSVALPYWTSGGIVRKNAAGTTQTPDFAATELRYWKQRTIAEWTYQYRRGRDIVAAADGSFATAATRDVAHITTFSPATPDLAAVPFIQNNHWVGLFDSDPLAVADDLIGSLFLTPDAETPYVTPPEEVWIWDSCRYYWITIPTNQRSAVTAAEQKQIDAVRHSFEKLFFGRPQWTSGDPTGGTVAATHESFLASNNLGDALWYRGNSTTVWRNSSGVLHATLIAQGLTINFTSGGATAKLAPYFTAGQIAGTTAITQADVEDAIAHYISEYITSAVERAATLIAAHESAGTGPVIPAYTTVVGRVPTPDITVTLSSGEVRPLSIGEEVNNIAAGTTPEKWVLCADNVFRQFAGGTSSGPLAMAVGVFS